MLGLLALLFDGFYSFKFWVNSFGSVNSLLWRMRGYPLAISWKILGRFRREGGEELQTGKSYLG
jgi:hypothetical protein